MNIEQTYDTIENEKYTEDQYKEMIDETTPEINIGSLTFSPSRILEELDPIAFRCRFNDYQEYEEAYECTKCNIEYETEEEAAECCHVECLECNEWHETEEEANKCCEEEED